MSDDPLDDVEPQTDVPEHAFETEGVVFTEEDDRDAPHLAVPDDDVEAADAGEGIDALIRAAREADDA